MQAEFDRKSLSVCQQFADVLLREGADDAAAQAQAEVQNLAALVDQMGGEQPDYTRRAAQLARGANQSAKSVGAVSGSVGPKPSSRIPDVGASPDQRQSEQSGNLTVSGLAPPEPDEYDFGAVECSDSISGGGDAAESAEE